MDLLAGSDDDSSTYKAENTLKINKKYAKSYEQWRKKEEKKKLTDKYGDDLDSSSSSEEEITSTPMLDKEWLRAYSVVRFQQPRLYSGEKLFNEEAKAVTKKKEKKVTLKDHERKFITEKGGVDSDADEDEIHAKEAGPGYYEEQEEIKSSLKKAIGDFDNDDDDVDSLLVQKSKTEDEKREEENDYLAWLKGDKKELEDTKASEELAPLKAYWSNPNLTDKEKTLRDYILNNGYMDREGSDDDISDDDDDGFGFDEEEEFLDQAEAFEKTYNFRHEEPGGCEIKTYPRMIESSVRLKQDNRRAEMRKKKAEKKRREKEETMEEMKTLQRLQREEKEEKLRKLQELADNPDLKYGFDTDFDPEEHDKIMKKYFDDGYYQHEDAGKKPVFEPDEAMEDGEYKDETDDWWRKREQSQMEMEEEIADDEGEDKELYADDPGFVMDADYDPTKTHMPTKSKKETKKERKEAKKAKKNKKLGKAPLFDPTTKSFDEYLDEYLKDKINKLPFTYREVLPNDFGLSTDEILEAPDKELNAWVSVKRLSQYRMEEDEKYDFDKFKQISRNTHKKHKVLPSLAPKQKKMTQETSDITKPKTDENKKKKKKQKKQKPKIQQEEDEEDVDKNEALSSDTTTPGAGVSSEPKKKKKKKPKKHHDEQDVNDEILPQENTMHDADALSESKKKKRKMNNNDQQNEVCVKMQGMKNPIPLTN